MTPKLKHTLIVLLMLLASVTLIGLSLPHSTRQMTSMLSYEVGKPWRNPTLIAPFDIPFSYDEATISRITDSVQSNYVHFYEHNTSLANQKVLELDQALKELPDLPTQMRKQVVSALANLYNDGIVDAKTYEDIRAGHTRQINILQGKISDTTIATDEMHSVIEAYQTLDSLLATSPYRQAVLGVGLNNYLEPNYSTSAQDSVFLDAELDRALQPPPGVQVQMGEAIIFTGNVVTPEKSTVIQAYQNLLEENNKKRSGNDNYSLLGQIAIVTILLIVFYAFFRLMRPRVFGNLRQMVFLLTLVTLMVVAVLWIVRFRQNYMYLIPFAMVPIIVTTFFDTRIAFFVHLIVVLICSMVAQEQAAFIIMQFIAGAIAVASMQELTRRSQLVRCAALILVAYCLSFSALELVRGVDLKNIDWHHFVYFAVNCFILSFAYVVIFLVEKVFGFTSTVTLVELSDINSPLLRRLSESCPGTFQHALQVANIASEAALEIGANSQLVRAGALYHDIGKSENPAFFTENQSGINPHDALDPEQSAAIVIQHVTDGLHMAERARLPQVIRDIIAQHHGCGVTRYFYTQACNAHPDQTIDPEPFTYPGPNPQTREAAIVMMADACEAAAKSLKEYTEQAIQDLVERIVNAQVASGLLREAPISFRDVETVKRVFVERLKSFYHTRISYPTAAGA